MVLRIAKNSFLVLISLAGSHFLAIPFGMLLSAVLGLGGSFGGNTLEYYMFGLPIAATVLLIFLFSTLGDEYKRWWIGLALLPIIWFESQLAPILLPCSLFFGAIAWGLGYLANKTLKKMVPRFMGRIS